MANETAVAQSAQGAPACGGGFVGELSRKEFLRKLGWACFATYMVGSVLAMLRFMFPNVLYEPPTSFKAGKPDEYPINSVSTKWTKSKRVWVVRTPKGFYALWARCTHLGCTPNWFESERRFKCPCHGSNFTMQGDVIFGPAPKPLYRAAIAKTDDGQLLIDKGRLENRPGARERGDFFLPHAENA